MRPRRILRGVAVALAVLLLAGCTTYTRLAKYKERGKVWVAVLPVADLTPQVVQRNTRIYRRPPNVDGPQLVYRMIVRDLTEKKYVVLSAADFKERLRAHKVLDPLQAHTVEPADLARWLDVDVVLAVTLVRFHEIRSPEGDLTLWVTHDVQVYDARLGRVTLQDRFDQRLGGTAVRWMPIKGMEGAGPAALDPYEARVLRALDPSLASFP